MTCDQATETLGFTRVDLAKETPYASSLDHILAELQCLHVRLQAEVQRFRNRQKADAGLRGLAISEEEIDDFLAVPLTAGSEAGLTHQHTDLKEAIERRVADSQRCGNELRLVELARRFELTPYELDCVLICLAPEIDLRYERLYGYLQDDVTKRCASVDLILRLLSSPLAQRMTDRHVFGDDARLMRHGILRIFEDPNRHTASLLGSSLRMDARIANYLLGSDECDARLPASVRRIDCEAGPDQLACPPEIKERLARIAGLNSGLGPIFLFHGPQGAGKLGAAKAFCAVRGTKLLLIDSAGFANAEDAKVDSLFRLAVREARLQGAATYWQGFDLLTKEEHRSLPASLIRTLQETRDLTFVATERPCALPAETQAPVVSVAFPRPTAAERWPLWTTTLGQDTPSDTELSPLVAKFRLTGGQIRAAAATARNLAFWRDPVAGRPNLVDLYEGCRLQSNQKLGSLATKVRSLNAWSDMVLPADRIGQLQEICNQVKYRSQVYDTWGFDRKIALSKGLAVLFAGPPGTGKTMAAGIMAGQLGMDLYKIDLASVVSKYIGETEKNLSKIFSEAETANAILFFDEADALFGKRSEVRDSHDRYANIEVGYLLQRMEEYEGVLILCTNFRRNMDDAFVRRLHAAIEFPLPDARDRLRIWQSIWPSNAPLRELNFEFLAQRFSISGGNIRNIALAAAFLAAADGGSVTMTHILDATRREYQKMGKIIAEGEFDNLPAANGLRV